MKHIQLVLFFLLIVSANGQSEGGTNPDRVENTDVVAPRLPQSTVSVDKLFRVFGGQVKERTEVIKVAEKVNREWAIEMKERKEDQNNETVEIKNSDIPVYIVLKRLKEEENPDKNIFFRSFGKQMDGTKYVRLTIDMNVRFHKDLLRAAIVEMLLLKRSIVSLEELPEDLNVVVHPWVVDGVLEIIEWRVNKQDRIHYERLAKNPKLFNFSKMLEIDRTGVEKLDDTTYKSYKAAAGAMVMTLIKQPNGLPAFRSMLEELAFFEGDMKNLLKRHFPSVNKGENGERIAWLLQLNTMAMKPLSDSLSIIETERELSSILLFRVIDQNDEEQTYALQEHAKILKLGDDVRKAAIKGALLGIERLENRCFPLYRPILFQYATVLNALSKGEAEGIDELVSKLNVERGLKRQAAVRARDYTDWYVLNHSKNVQGDFGRFGEIEESFLKKSRDSSEMSTYLDTMESFFSETKKQ